MQAGRPPERTGIEGRERTDEERRLTKKVNEAKKRGGYVVTDPAKQLKSALSTAKTAANNILTDLDAEIRELEQSIATRTARQAPEAKTTLEADKELKDLRERVAQRREQRDKLKAEYEKIFPPTRQQRIKTAEEQAKAAQRQIESIQEQLKAEKIGKRTHIQKGWNPLVRLMPSKVRPWPPMTFWATLK